MANRGINKVILIGNLGQDPEVRYMPNGGAVANITLATSESWRDKNTGEMKEKTEWHRIVLFGKLAEIAREYLRKGSQVYIEGTLQTRKWQDQNGIDRYTTEIIVNISGTMHMLGSRNTNYTVNSGQNQYSNDTVKETNILEKNNMKLNTLESDPKKKSLIDDKSQIDFDDDIPF